MKRFSKILVAVLALCLLVGALALAISANTGVEGKFVVQGTGYEKWEDALAAANNTHTIYINENWELETGITLSGETTNVKVNLNGKTVSVKDGSMLFNVHTNAKLTIEGEGTFNSVSTVLIGGSSSGTVTVNATGKGIVINNNINNTEADVNTFRFQSWSTLNVSGKIVVNTNAVTKSRALFNIADSGAKTVSLNITDADISFATPSVAKCPAGKLIYSQFSDIDINNSKLDVVYGYMFYSATTASLNGTVADYIEQFKIEGSETNYLRWLESAKAEAAKKLSITVKENITANNSTLSSRLGGYAGRLDGNFMTASGATKADFTNSIIVSYGRAFNGDSAKCLGVDSGSVLRINANSTQLSFYDSHITNSGEPVSSGDTHLFCYGPNFRVLGGSIRFGGTLANGQTHYLELTDAEGNPTGQWLGGYVDNVLGVSGLKGDNTLVSTQWQTPVAFNPHAIFKGTLPHSVTIPVNGKDVTFTTGYITDDNFISVIHKLDGNNVTAGAFHSKNNNPFYPIVVPPSNASSSECVLDANGNGYLKYSYTGAAANVNNWWYPKIGSFTDSDYIVFEFDIAADELEELPVSEGNFQFRETTPYFGVDGSYIGDSSLIYTNFSNYGFNGDRVRFNYTYYNISTEPGFWNRLTVVFELNKGPVEKIKIQAFNADKTPATDESGNPIYVEKNAYSIDDSKAHFYVNGVLMSSVDFAPSTWGYHVSTVNKPVNANAVIYEGATKSGAYIIEGYESKYYLGSDIRMGASASKPSAICLDNFYLAKYTVKADNLLGLYDENGALKKTITPNDYVLVMPDNNGLYVPAPVVAEVDGVGYSTEADAIAAIKEGSTVELFKNFESLIEANVAFKLITNGFSLPGFVSSTHKLLDYMDGMGFYKLVLADASELYTVNYSYNGKDVTQTVAKGTVIPAMEEYFPAILNGEKLLAVDSWTVPKNVNDYELAGNVITAVAVPVEKDAVAVAGNVAYETVEDAILDAHGDPIKLLKDITVDPLDGVVASTYITTKATSKTNVPVGINIASGANVTIDFNGKTVTQNFEGVLFNVTNGTLTLTGAATFNNVGTFARATGENSKVVVEATGDGFCVNEFVSAGGIYNVFVAEGKADLAVSGKIAINNAYSTILFKVSGSDTIEFNNANVVNDGPTEEQGRLASQFFAFAGGVTVNIESSTLQVNCGNMFQLSATTTTPFSIEDKLLDPVVQDGTKKYVLYAKEECLENGMLKDVYFPEFESTITANNSTLIAAEGRPALANQDAIGGLFKMNKTSVKVVMNNCDLTGSNRTFDGGDRPLNDRQVAPNQFVFTDVDYTEIYSTDKTKDAYSRNMFQESINIIWNGGTIGAFKVGTSFTPMFAQNGVIGIHLFNTNVAEGKGGNDWTKPQSSVWSAAYYVSYKNAIALVDATVCKTADDFNAAIKDGSKVMLLKEANITADKAFDVYTSNGYIPAGIVSATHKAVVDAKGNIKVSAALPEEIFTINYAFGGKTATQNAALGTVIATPEGIDDRFVDSDSKKVVVLKGWTLVDGENVIVVTGNANAIAKYVSADPVIVYWTTADGATVLDTDYYLPGEYTTLPEFNGEDIAVDHSADYYGIGRIGWDGIDTVKLDVAGENTVKAVMGKVAPDTFPGLKYNFTLYAFHVLNFYIPQDIEGVTVDSVSVHSDGSVALELFQSGTLENRPYDQYRNILGAADEDLGDYYIKYTLEDGTKLTFAIKNIGVPSYAVQVMKDYENKNEAKDVAAKTLIVNMANYADKVLTVTNGDKTTPGAMAYTYILNTYGAQYLTRYNNLTNDKFLEGGEIYKADGVADLNWILYHDSDASNDDAANAEALSYIKSISFVFDTYEPKFIMELSDAAIKLGIQKPDANGNSAAHAPGLHAYSGFTNPTGYCKVWAKDADGKEYKGGTNIWYDPVKGEDGSYTKVNNCDADKYDYFISGQNYGVSRSDSPTHWNVHQLKDMTNNFIIKLEVEADDASSATTGDRIVGCVYYSLAAYINSMMDAEGEAEANADFIAAAKALYAYSEAAAAYKAQ